MKQKLLLYLLVLMGTVQRAMAQEPYAVLSDDNTVLTFYYDNNKSKRNGMSVGPFKYDDYGPTTSWYAKNFTITTVVFDASFANCTSLTSTACWFYECSKLTSISGIENLKTDNVTDMSYMFTNCFVLTSLDVSGFNTDNVTNMSCMFCDCWKLTSLDVSGFKTDNVTDMSRMFEDCRSLMSLDVSNFNTENVTNMSGMFYYCSSLPSLDIRVFKTNNVTDMSFMFSNCWKLTSLDVSGFKTDNVTDMNRMFSSCQSLTSLDVSSFKTENVTDMWGMFNYCICLTSLDVSGFNTKNVTNMEGMFGSCQSLTSLDVSGFNTKNVTNMEGMFSDCSSLTSLDLRGFNTENVTKMGNMFSDCSSLTSLDVSGFNTKNVTNMSGMFNDCSSLTSLDLSGFNTENVTNMVLMFSLCSELTTIYANYENWNTEKVTDSEFIFANCDKLVGGNGTKANENPMTIEYARIDLPGFPGYLTDDKTLVGTAVTLNVADDSGNDITEDVNIVWYDGDGKQIGTGSKLNGVAEDAKVYYSVVLDETLGRVYREVTMQKADADEEGGVACQLEKIGHVTLEGRVSATDIDKTTATIGVRQMLNGKWQQDYSTQTDRQGAFSVEVYDDVTDITISGDGYLDATMHRDGFGGNGNVGTIPVRLLTGFAIAANISMENVVADGETAEVTAWTGGLSNIDFVLTNQSSGTALTDIAVQGGNVIIKSGAAVGNEISLKAVSKQGVFADAETTFTIADGANGFDLQLKELGGVDATYTATGNSTTVGYLYDNNGVLAARGSYKGETLSLRHLKSGTYTLVSMGQSLLLGGMTNMADLTAVGLNEGADYVSTSIEVADGELTTVSISNVPQLDETPFYYTTGNTYFNASKASVTAGNYITLQARVALKPEHTDKADGVTLTIDLPEGCQMVENSVIANHAAVPHTVSGNRVTMTLNKEQLESEVRFCVTPTLNRDYTVTAMATFDIDGQVQQPIGTTRFEAKGFSLNVPARTDRTTVTISGTAKGHSEVSIYDNDVLVGTTTSKADGSWTTQCELYKPYSPSFHDIYAKVVTEDGMELTSETRQVEYNKTLVPEKVTMTYYNGWYRENKTVVFDLLSGKASPSSWSFFTATDFTFLADFTLNDSTVIKNVNIKVLNSDGTVRTLPATFDGKQGKWVATTKYSSASRLPQNVTVEYDEIDAEMLAFDPVRIIDDNNQYVNLIKNYIANVDTTKIEILSADESVMIGKYQTYTMNTPVYIRLEKLNYDAMIGELESTDYFSFDNDGTVTYVCDSAISETHHIDWAWKKDKKEMLQIELSDKNEFTPVTPNRSEQSPSRDARRLPAIVGNVGRILGKSVLNIFCNAADIIDIIKQYNEGYKELSFWQTKYGKTLDDQMKLYKKAKLLLNAQCPDGSSRIPEEVYSTYSVALGHCFNKANDMRKQFEKNLKRLEFDLVRRRDASAQFSATMCLLGAASMVKGVGPTTFKEFAADFLKDTAKGQVKSDAWDWLLRNEFYTADKLSDWYYPESMKIISDYSKLMSSIEKAYKKCEKEKKDEEENEEDNEEEKKDEPLDEKSDDKDAFKGDGSKVLIDPSGYVYEAVLSNRLEGVTTTCYEQVNGEAVAWNAEDYSQQNPLRTDEAGFYRWDVPQGMWKVKYEKEGYETTSTDWLPVPPPQLDVNVGMKQSTPPTVEKMHGTEGGITITMQKYMRPETLTENTITVTRNDIAEEGRIELLNMEKEPAGEQSFASKVKFVPQTRFKTSDEVWVTVGKDVESYCGVKMGQDHRERVEIESEITNIVADGEVSVAYQGTREMQVLVLPREASAGRKLTARTASAMIASLSEEQVTIDENGLATLTLKGDLPGGTVLTLGVDGSDVETTTKVSVLINRTLVAVPQASIRNGEQVPDGTKLSLTCDTEGATIYYTLDGSCPCDPATRKEYTGTIDLPNGVVTVKAMAETADGEESDVVTFVYTVDVATGIAATKTPKDFGAVCRGGYLVVTGAEGAALHVYDLQGRELASRRGMGKVARISVPQCSVYVVCVQFADGDTAVRKVTGQ